MKFINDQYEKYLQEEVNINRKKRIPDTRVHCCLYFIPATGHSYVPSGPGCDPRHAAWGERGGPGGPGRVGVAWLPLALSGLRVRYGTARASPGPAATPEPAPHSPGCPPHPVASAWLACPILVLGASPAQLPLVTRLCLSLRPLDIEFMKRLSKVVNIVPVIAKADTLTLEERVYFKQRVGRCSWGWWALRQGRVGPRAPFHPLGPLLVSVLAESPSGAPGVGDAWMGGQGQAPGSESSVLPTGLGVRDFCSMFRQGRASVGWGLQERGTEMC